MSIEAMAWALNADVGDPIAKLVLIGLASHARADGTASWPSKNVLAKYAGVSTRTVVTKLQSLEDMKLIALGDQRLTEYMRADRRPRVWDVLLPRGEGSSPREDDYLRGESITSPRSGERGESIASPRKVSRGEAPRRHGVKAVSHKTSLEPSYTEDSLRSSSAQLTARDLVAEWIDHCNGTRPPGRVVGHVAKEIDIMLREGIPYADIRSGLQYWQSKGLHPSALASAVHEVRTANSGGLKSRRQLETDAQFDRALTRARKRDQNRPKEITP